MTWIRRALAGLVVLVIVGALAAGMLVWRIAHGGIDLAFVLPSIERALARPGFGVTVRIAGASLEWDRTAHRPALHARDVRLLGADGNPLAVLPIVALEPSVPALLQRRFALHTIEVVGARLRAIRTPDGSLDLGLAEGERAGSSDLLRRLRATPAPGSPAETLERVELSDGEILVTDAATDATWRLTAVHLTIERTDTAITATLTGDGELGSALVPLRLDAVQRLAPPEVTATLWFSRLVPAAAATLAPTGSVRAALARVDLPIGGTLHAKLDGDLALRTVRLDAGGGPGSIATPEVPRATIAVERVALVARFDAVSDTLQLETLAVDLGGAHVAAHGGITRLRDARRITLDATVDRLPVADLAGWWPPEAAPAARAWVTSRITRGTVRAATLHLTGSAAAGDLAPDALTLATTFDDLTVRYLDTMPVARRVAGTMKMAAGRWRFHVGRGAIEDLDVAHGTVDIGGRPARARVDAAVRGAIPSALGLALRMNRTADIGIDPGQTDGNMTADLRVDVPLAGTTRGEEVSLTLAARLTNASWARAVKGWSFANGDLAVDLRGGNLRVSGGGRLEGVPITLAWEENADRAGRRRRVDASGRLDTAARTALGFDLLPWIDGPADTRIQLVQQAGSGTLDLGADLVDARLDVPILAIDKKPGSPGRFDARLLIAGDAVSSVERFALEAGAASVTGRATLAAGHSVRTLDLAAVIPARDAGAAPGHLTLALTPASTGSQFMVTSDDAGALFRSFGAGADASGGRLRFSGTLGRDAPGDPLDGHIAITDFTLRRAPGLARVATLSSLSGIAGALSGRGIPFDRLDAKIGYRDSILTIADGVALGPSLGLSANATIDRPKGTGEMRGTLVPSYYGLNTAAKRIPVLGGFLTGKEGEGVQAFDFTITGSLAAPRVNVKASSLAPGALRDLVRRLGRGGGR